MALGAVIIPMAVILILVAIVTATNIGDATPGKPLGSLLAILTFVGVPIGSALAFGEEFGWRGYLLPKLLPLGEVKAAVIVGLIWGTWHLPALIVGLNYPGQPIIAVLAVFLLSATLLSLLHTRFYVASSYSLIAVSLLHGSLNTYSDRLTDMEHLSGDPLIRRWRRHRQCPRRRRHPHRVPRPRATQVLLANNELHKDNDHEKQNPNHPPDHHGADCRPGRRPDGSSAGGHRGDAPTGQHEVRSNRQLCARSTR
jgi:membrane protease YdiL (CAAX protease family)